MIIIIYFLSLATFHFHPFVHSVYKKPSDWASLHDIAIVPSDTQYWGTYTGFNNRPRKPKNYGDLKVSPSQFKEHVMKSFAAMNVTKWKTIHHNYFFIMAWVSTYHHYHHHHVHFYHHYIHHHDIHVDINHIHQQHHHHVLHHSYHVNIYDMTCHVFHSYTCIHRYYLYAQNEWNEQAVMEPSDRWGFRYLEALQEVLLTLPYRLTKQMVLEITMIALMMTVMVDNDDDAYDGAFILYVRYDNSR